LSPGSGGLQLISITHHVCLRYRSIIAALKPVFVITVTVRVTVTEFSILRPLLGDRWRINGDIHITVLVSVFAGFVLLGPAELNSYLYSTHIVIVKH